MNAIRQLYRNSGLITEDGYIKLRDGLWIKSGPYKEQTWNNADKSTLPTKEELNEIYLKFQELIQIQESCGLHSVRQILDTSFTWAWSLTECSADYAWLQRMSNGSQSLNHKYYDGRVIPIRRSP